MYRLEELLIKVLYIYGLGETGRRDMTFNLILFILNGVLIRKGRIGSIPLDHTTYSQVICG